MKSYLSKIYVGCTLWDWQHVNGEAVSYEVMEIGEYYVKCADEDGFVRNFPVILDEFDNEYIWLYMSRKEAEDDNLGM